MLREPEKVQCWERQPGSSQVSPGGHPSCTLRGRGGALGAMLGEKTWAGQPPALNGASLHQRHQ